MSDPTQRPAEPPASPPDEDDTQGNAFTWKQVDDPKRGRHLRQEWSPDDPKDTRVDRAGGSTPRKSTGPR